MTDTLLTFVHISDTHLSADPFYGADRGRYPALAGAEALVREVNRLPFVLDFVLHTGDVVYDPDEAAYAVARDVLGRIKFRVYYLAGNHDDPDMLQRALLGRADGVGVLRPFRYAFEVRGTQVVCLDSTGPAEPPRGFVSQDQLAWLEAICSADEDHPLIVAVHHNVLPVGGPWWDEFMRLINGEDLHRALLPARRRVRGVFFGHVHQNVDIVRDGIFYSGCLSSWCQFHSWPGQAGTVHDTGAEPGFSVVTVTREQTYVRRCRFRVEP